MSMGTLFVHAGPPKTGTSAIQHALLQGTDDGALYPRTGLWWDGAHHNLVFNFYGDYRRPDMERRDITAMLAEIGAAARATSRNIVISSEALWGHDVGGFIRAVLAHAGERPVEILAACREHSELMASNYNQRVKDGFFGETRAPGDFLDQEAGIHTYAPMLRTWRDSGFAVRAMAYHPAGDFVARFLRHVGSTLVPDAAQRNLSLSRKGLAAMLAVNRVADGMEDRARHTALLEKMPGFHGGAGAIFDAQAMARSAAIFAQDARLLREEHGVELPPPRPAGDFGIGPAELDDIAVALKPLGPRADAVLEAARAWIR